MAIVDLAKMTISRIEQVQESVEVDTKKQSIEESISHALDVIKEDAETDAIKRRIALDRMVNNDKKRIDKDDQSYGLNVNKKDDSYGDYERKMFAANEPSGKKEFFKDHALNRMSAQKGDMSKVTAHPQTGYEGLHSAGLTDKPWYGKMYSAAKEAGMSVKDFMAKKASEAHEIIKEHPKAAAAAAVGAGALAAGLAAKKYLSKKK